VNLSAILIVTPSGQIRAACDDLNSMDGVDVHHVDVDADRAILTQEAASVEDEVEGLRRIQEHPSIALAEMVEHHFDRDFQPPE
jgi:nitrate reductase NapAB chaperone NapD